MNEPIEKTMQEQSIIIKWQKSVILTPNNYKIAETVKSIIAREMLVTVEQIESRSRMREYVIARQLAMYFIKIKTSMTLKQIGALFSGRDHSTVIHAMETIDDLICSDKKFKAQFEYLQEII